MVLILTHIELLGCDSGHVGGVAGDEPPAVKPPSSTTCAAKTCESLGLRCGKASDGCGHELDCGACDPSCINDMWFYGTDDSDNDGYLKVDPNIFVKGCSAPEPYTQRVDCDDSKQGVYLTRLLYKDQDGDGFGYGAQLPACVNAPEDIPAGYSVNDLDCDDLQKGITTQDSSTVYVDNDHDGYGTGEPMKGCPSSSRSFNQLDCDDNNSAAFVNRLYYVDADQDGYGAGALVNVCWNNSHPPAGYSANNSDCNDANAQAFTLRSFYYDNDGDGHGTGGILGQECVSPSGLPPQRALDNTDCNDSDPTGWVWRSFYPQDNDQDGYGVSRTQITACTGDAATLGGMLGGGDCNDSDPNKHPGQINFFAEATFGSFDYNCDGQITREVDGRANCQAPWAMRSGLYVEGWDPHNPGCGTTACWARFISANAKANCVPDCEYRVVKCN